MKKVNVVLGILLVFICITTVFSLSAINYISPASHSLMNDPDTILNRKEVFNENYELEWLVNFVEKTIEFTTTVRTTGYIGFGISYTGGMTGADLIIGGIFPNGTSYFSDRHAEGEFEPIVDESQEWKLISGSENATHTILTFSRVFDTCDKNDIPISEESLKMIWSFGATDKIFYHGTQRGVLAVNILDPEEEIPDLSQYKVWRVVREQLLPSADTTYMCTFFKGPSLSMKNHIIGFDMFFDTFESKRHTHHADLYKCKAPNGQNATEYFSKYLANTYDCYFDKEYFPVEHCQLFEFQWSIGGKITIFPEDIGVPIGEDADEFYMTEIHYDNPQKLDNLKVVSGMEFYYTDKLRPIEAGFLQIGTQTSKTYSVTVPPNTDKFILNSHCPSECTNLIPQDGINVFMFLLHSHLSGREIQLRHFRNGKELPYVAYDENYDFNYQNNRLLRNIVKLLPGDQFTLECTYDTRWKNGSVVSGGRSPREEMCQVFLMHYPRTEAINQCGSYFPQLEMLKYMGIENVTSEKGEIDPKVILPEHLKGKLYSEVVESLDWTDEKRTEFQEMFRHSDHQSYCYPYHMEETEGVMTNYPENIQEYEPPIPCAEN